MRRADTCRTCLPASRCATPRFPSSSWRPGPWPRSGPSAGWVRRWPSRWPSATRGARLAWIPTSSARRAPSRIRLWIGILELEVAWSIDVAQAAAVRVELAPFGFGNVLHVQLADDGAEAALPCRDQVGCGVPDRVTIESQGQRSRPAIRDEARALATRRPREEPA